MTYYVCLFECCMTFFDSHSWNRYVVERSFKEFQGVQEVSRSFKEVQGVSRSFKEFQGVSGSKERNCFWRQSYLTRGFI